MSSDIFSSEAARNHVHLVTFRAEGAGCPLFCFPGAGGDVEIFRDLVAALPKGYPIYGIDMRWLCEVAPQVSIGQIAAYYLNLIRNRQKGPYFFCGYSFGGLVAYEMAVRLSRIGDGEHAQLVALLDAANPAMLSNLSGTQSVQFVGTYFKDRLKKYALDLLRGDLKAFIRRGFVFVFNRTKRLFIRPMKFGCRLLNRPLPRNFLDDRGFVRAWRTYVPPTYPGRIVCFRVEERGAEYDRDVSMGWNACVQGGVEIHVSPGGHLDMMNMPSVLAIADTLAPYLDGGVAG
jgi:thioesterase domain-containing protein